MRLAPCDRECPLIGTLSLLAVARARPTLQLRLGACQHVAQADERQAAVLAVVVPGPPAEPGPSRHVIARRIAGRHQTEVDDGAQFAPIDENVAGEQIAVRSEWCAFPGRSRE